MKTSEVISSQEKKPSKISSALVLASLALAVVGALVVVPRPTSPHILPLPSVDRDYLQETEKREVARAQQVMNGSLSPALRSVGEQLRRVGFSMAQNHSVEGKLLISLRGDARQLLRAERVEELLNLRALQGELFLRAVHEWEKDATRIQDVMELGGSFYRIAQATWRSKDGDIVLLDHELRLFFRLHWGKLTALGNVRSFAPDLEEYRRYYRTNLLYPHGAGPDPTQRKIAQLSFAKALRRLDPQYPGGLAVGMLELELGRFEQAERSLSSYLSVHDNGDWANIARNHLLLAKFRLQSINSELD